DQDERDDDREDRGAGDLASEARRDRRRTCTGRADLVLEIARDLAQLRAAQRLGPNLERRILAVSRAAASLHDRVRIAVVRHHPLDVAGSLRRRRLELELRSALEVDA